MLLKQSVQDGHEPLRVCVLMSLGACLLAVVACVLVGSGVGGAQRRRTDEPPGRVFPFLLYLLRHNGGTLGGAA